MSAVVEGPKGVKGIPARIEICGFEMLLPEAQKRNYLHALEKMMGLVRKRLWRIQRDGLATAGLITTLCCLVVGAVSGSLVVVLCGYACVISGIVLTTLRLREGRRIVKWLGETRPLIERPR